MKMFGHGHTIYKGNEGYEEQTAHKKINGIGCRWIKQGLRDTYAKDVNKVRRNV